MCGGAGTTDRQCVISHKAGQDCRLQASSWGVGLLLLSQKVSDTCAWFRSDTQLKIEYLNPKKERVDLYIPSHSHGHQCS